MSETKNLKEDSHTPDPVDFANNIDEEKHGEPSAELTYDSHEIARKVLPFLSERQIPVTPTNYRLWFEYFAGGSPELKASLDQLIADRSPFTPEVSQALYQRFFSLEAVESHSRLVGQAGEKIQTMAVNVIKNLLVSIARTSQYSMSLGGHIESIENANGLRDVREIVESVIEETGIVLDSNDKFQRSLEHTSKELADLQEEIRRRDELAHTDELTKLYNRRAFNVRLAEETSRARRYENKVSLIIIDIDDFKAVNDTFGHLVGDRLLAMIAKSILGAVRNPDFAARYGGEEFVIICPQTDTHGAELVAERLRKTVAETSFTVRGQPIETTISAGVASLSRADSIDDLVDRADRALYLAKRRGKNRVVTDEDL